MVDGKIEIIDLVDKDMNVVNDPKELADIKKWKKVIDMKNTMVKYLKFLY